MVKNCDLGLENQYFQDLGHTFSPYGPPSRQITYIYSIWRNSREICAQKYCNRCKNKLINVIFLCNIISLFKFLLKQLFTLVSVASGGYLPGHFAARLTSITSHLKFGEWLLHIQRQIPIFSINESQPQRNKIDPSLSKLPKFGLWLF